MVLKEEKKVNERVRRRKKVARKRNKFILINECENI
jgi:hypothetical protein